MTDTRDTDTKLAQYQNSSLNRGRSRRYLRTCGECVVDAVEGDGVDGIHLLDAVLLQSVAFEGVFLLLHLQTRIQILHRDSALNRAQHVTLKSTNHSMTSGSAKIHI